MMVKKILKKLLVFCLITVILVNNCTVTSWAMEESEDEVIEHTQQEYSEISNIEEDIGDVTYNNDSDLDIEENDVYTLVSADNESAVSGYSENAPFASLNDLMNSGVATGLSLEGNNITVNGSEGLILLSCVDSDFNGYVISITPLSGNYYDLSKDVSGYSFRGFGSESNPFRGTLMSTQNNNNLYFDIDKPFFNVLDASLAKIGDNNNYNLYFRTITNSDSTTVLAAKIINNGDWSRINISVIANVIEEGQVKNYFYPGSLIGEIYKDSSFTINSVSYLLDNRTEYVSKVVNGTNVGLLCNDIGENGTLTINNVSVAGKVEFTGNGAVGGLIGLMKDGSSLIINNENSTFIINDNWSIDGKYSGGLIGQAINIKLNLYSEVNGARVKSHVSNGGTGGLIGYYQLSKTNNIYNTYNNQFKVSRVILDATADYSFCGGVFGILEQSASTNFVVSPTEMSINSEIGIAIDDNNSQFSLKSTTTYGGFAGKYICPDSSSGTLPSLKLNDISLITKTNSSILYYGGAVGAVGDVDNKYFKGIGSNGDLDAKSRKGAYISVKGIINTDCTIANGSVKSFGGLAGVLLYDSVLEIKEESTFTPNLNNPIEVGGSIVGAMGRRSTLCLSGKTDISNIKYKATNTYQNYDLENNQRNSNGQIVGVQNAALIYAKRTWELIRNTNPGQIDDIGNYGSIIRLGGNQGRGSDNLYNTGILYENLIVQNTDSHRTEFSKNKLTLTDDKEITISNADDFALLAIAEQTYEDFDLIDGASDTFVISKNYITKITIENDIDLSNTGINGFQRDVCGSNIFTGTLDGKGNTITLGTGTTYASNGSTVGIGQIHGHSRIGLFSQANCIIQNLTISGTLSIYELKKDGNSGAVNKAIAGAVAYSDEGNNTFNSVICNLTINCYGIGTDSFIGGLLGIKGGSGDVDVFSCQTASIINDYTTNGKLAIGGIIGSYDANGTITIINASIKGSISNENTVAYAKYGGLISLIRKDKTDSNWNELTNPVSLYLDNVSVYGLTIDNKATKASGGLLGYDWERTEVYFGNDTPKGLNIISSSNISTGSGADLGGLVYRATGYWQINDLGISNLTLNNGNGNLGLLACYGRKEKDETMPKNSTYKSRLLYVEETGPKKYRIDKNSVNIYGTGGYFDEWVVYTATDAASVVGNINSVISISSIGENGFDSGVSSSTGYQNKVNCSKIVSNPNARYYYDVNKHIESSAVTDSIINTEEELILWSLRKYTEGTNIETYFSIGDVSTVSEVIGGETETKFDLKGYSYYPISIINSNLTVKNCTFKFANDFIETAEKLTGGDLDDFNRITVGTSNDHTQHYLLHNGLFLNYENNTTNIDQYTLNINSVSLEGVIGKGENNEGSGAIIRGAVSGSNGHYAIVNFNGITLNGIRVSEIGNYNPLLLNKVSSYSTIDTQNLTTSGYSDYSSKVATSLMGNIGGNDATNISLAFHDGISLNNFEKESIFKNSSLLESFCYASSSTGYYHFTKNDDDNSDVTFGKELTSSIEYDGENGYYYSYAEEREKVRGETSFTDYLPYVHVPYSADSNFHELAVNIPNKDLITGCGTYGHPYGIDTAGQLEMVAKYLSGNAAISNWKIKVATNTANYHTEDGECRIFVYEGNIWKALDDDSVTKTETDMRNYLRNAYFQINTNLKFMDYVGMGSENYPFVGVIDGNGKTVSVNISKLASGFVNVSYGSVIQDLTINYYGTKTLKNTKALHNSNAVANESYFGGIIGDVKGGDNIVDNVIAIYPEELTITAQNHLQCIGGYFGIVEGGGIVLKNINPENTVIGLKTTQIIYAETNGRYYMSPLLGRVLDGFVVCENNTSTEHVLKSLHGSDSNYNIPIINPSDKLGINVVDDILEISINSAQDLLILSAIINSGSCNVGYSLSYKGGYAKVRNANYKNRNVANFVSSKSDDSVPSQNNLSYLITNYVEITNGDKSDLYSLCMTSASSAMPGKYVDLRILSGLNMSNYGNGYRGIGARYNCTATSDSTKDASKSNTFGKFQSSTPSFVNISGNSKIISVDNVINAYSDDNYVVNAAGGLINVLRRKVGTILNVSNIIIKGNVSINDFSDTNSKTIDNAANRKYASSVGGLIGRYFTEETSIASDNRLILNNIGINQMNIYGDAAAGGIIGQTGTYNLYVFGSGTQQYASGVTYKNCYFNKLNLISNSSSGGFVGAACDNASTYNYSNKNNGDITNSIIVDTNKLISGNDSSINTYATNVSPCGTGGLIGNIGSNFNINDGGTYLLVMQKVRLQEKNVIGSIAESRTGGIAGFIHHGKTVAYNLIIQDSTMGNGKDDNLAGVVGCWFSTDDSGILENITVENVTLDAAKSVGGIIGYIANSKVIKDITIKNVDITQRNNDDGRGAALIVGQINSGGISGENICIKGGSVTANTNNKGRLVGINNSKQVQFIGVSVQYSDLTNVPVKDIGSITYSNYNNQASVIQIVYDAFNTNEITSGNELGSKPSITIQDGLVLEGDTANPEIVINKILRKTADNYDCIGSSNTYQNVDGNSANKLSSTLISTYNDNQDTEFSKNFNVLQIDGDASCIRQYINIATNGAYDNAVTRNKININANKNPIMYVSISRYKLDNGVFVSDDSNKITLKYEPTGDFYATANYDNQNNTFTLITITFKEDNGKYSRTYHVPVIVRRMLQVDFIATTVGGTAFAIDKMQEYTNHAVASQGEFITAYLTFKYNSNLSGDDANFDWKNYMEAGANLLSYYKKDVITGAGTLAKGTKITLIDCQDNDKQFSATLPESSILKLYNNPSTPFSDKDGKAFKPTTLAELLKITASSWENGKKWVVSENVNEATTMAKDLSDAGKTKCFRLATDSDIGPFYQLEIGNEHPEENYVIVISIPEEANHKLLMTSSSMVWENGLPVEVHQIHRYTTNDKHTVIDPDKTDETSFNFLKNYEQNITDNRVEKYSAFNSVSSQFLEMPLDITNAISYSPNSYTESDPLYQEFRIDLNKLVDTKNSSVHFPSDATATIELTAYYYNNNGEKVYFSLNSNEEWQQSNGRSVISTIHWQAGSDGNMVIPFAIENDDGFKYLNMSGIRKIVDKYGIADDEGNKFIYIEAKTTEDGKIKIPGETVLANNLLPPRLNENENILNYTSFSYISVLSTTVFGLSYSSIRTPLPEGNEKYYLNEKRDATLLLDYVDINQLGINPKDEYDGLIDTIVTLDFSNVEGFNPDLSMFSLLNDAESISFTFTLQQKGSLDDITSIYYSSVSISDYLEPMIVGVNQYNDFKFEIKNSEGKFDYYKETIGKFEIPVSFKVKVSDINLYSNYRICAKADIVDGSNVLPITNDKAFVTYTVAKINTSGVWEQEIN